MRDLQSCALKFRLALLSLIEERALNGTLKISGAKVARHSLQVSRTDVARVIRAPAAEVDAIGIWAYISQDNVAAADRLIFRLEKVLRNLALQPQMGREAGELAPKLRVAPVGTYLIFYRPIVDGIEVARILHGARDISAELFREEVDR